MGYRLFYELPFSILYYLTYCLMNIHELVLIEMQHSNASEIGYLFEEVTFINGIAFCLLTIEFVTKMLCE